ncbi:nuclear transport factor 2 family protein [Catenulispora subtropica]|uniref:Nuclear transport factor 2 family protein n=1 Tax=Catenulispora subtropica TaxID=450798 RepID=A0ABN2TAV5_9ACTN
MKDQLAELVDKAAVTDVVHAVFDQVDRKDWDAVRPLFAEEVLADFTSLAGGDPARIPSEALVQGWITGLHPKKQSFHSISNVTVTLDGDRAVADTKGYAYNRLDADLGGGLWEVWGTYRLAMRRSATGWRVDEFTFVALNTRGDDAVRTHAL